MLNGRTWAPNFGEGTGGGEGDTLNMVIKLHLWGLRLDSLGAPKWAATTFGGA